jgi:hypothetical protein
MGNPLHVLSGTYDFKVAADFPSSLTTIAMSSPLWLMLNHSGMFSSKYGLPFRP